MKRTATAAALAALLTLTGCDETAGYIDGTVRGTGEPVFGAFKSTSDYEQATAFLILDVKGQRYSGNIVPVGAGSTSSVSFGNAFGSAYGGGYSARAYAWGTESSHAYHSTATFAAMLKSDRGGMMRCDLHTSAPGTFKSGMGTCQTEGMVIDVTWSPDAELEAQLGGGDRVADNSDADVTDW